jgi:hypothetical protein
MRRGSNSAPLQFEDGLREQEMRAETEAHVDEIRDAIALIRRHL